ncbi:hypothetical protein ACFWY5_41575 [Nonomuraea sp. NPDC059007]|uniref:hypothetical protein n=1 Tax=Nonomuraea sp. NPDC059007 TaxID=3346692 RepID=UPI0036791E3F
MRQQLPAYARVGPIRADQQVADGRGVVGEEGGDGAVGVVPVAGELLAEVDDVIQAGEQQPP